MIFFVQRYNKNTPSLDSHVLFDDIKNLIRKILKHQRICKQFAEKGTSNSYSRQPEND